MFFRIGLGLVLFVLGAFAWAGDGKAKDDSSTDLIRIDARIAVEGALVAQPIVEILPGHVAELRLGSPSLDGMTIFLGSTGVQWTPDGIPYVNVEIWTELEGASTERLNATSIGLALGQEGSMSIRNAKGEALNVTAVATVRPLLESEALSSISRRNCCSAPCPNRPASTMTCCGAIRCCEAVCGTCCSPGGGGDGTPPVQEP